MKWKKAKFKIATEEGIKEVEGNVTTFVCCGESFKIGVFCIYQLTKNEFEKRLYSVTELTTGRRLTTSGSLSAASRYLGERKNNMWFCERMKFELNKIDKIDQFPDVLK